jgi:uncharacterized phage protein gp47/JayE
MAGLTPTGLTIKRLPEIIAGLQVTAEQIFADLAPTGDVVDTSAITALGRLIGLVAPSHADIWETLQDVHNSFSPQHASGIALDNIVALSGIARLPLSSARAHCLLTGDNNTSLSLAAKVSSSTTRRIFSLLAPVKLTPAKACGVAMSVGTVQASTVYRLSYTVDGITVIDVSINSGAAPTAASILTALQAAILATHSASFTAVIIGTLLWVKRSDPFQPVTFTASANLVFSKAQQIAVFECDVAGPAVQFGGTIDTIAVPVLGWDSVVNPLDASSGRNVETDPELRERFRVSKYFQAVNILEAMVDALKNVPEVVDVMVYENDTDTTDSYGVTPHAFMPIVLGGLTTSIGEAIWQNKPTGVKSIGNTTVSIADSQGLQHPISFFRPTLTRLYIKMTIQSTGLLVGNADVMIKDALVAKIKAENKIGTDVIYSRLYTPINSVAGFQINALTLGTAPNPTGMVNIVIPFNAVATLDAADITITIV